jgi:hypothetical protein
MTSAGLDGCSCSVRHFSRGMAALIRFRQVSWADDSNDGPDKSGRAIEGRVLTVPAGGL